jgi:predicted regulator of Ras-like GTPase activity (Roadblock/LC7/MglB family)
MSDARDKAVVEVLTDLEAEVKGSSAALVLRSGSLFAGRAPPAVNRETYAAMAAVMAGAAETGTADLGDPVLFVEVRLSVGALLEAPAGAKLLLVLHLPDASALAAASGKLTSAARRIAELF